MGLRKQVTERLQAARELLGTEVLDQLIHAPHDLSYSCAEAGMP
jgi:DNA repair protein RadC